MDPKEEKRLLELFDEVEAEEEICGHSERSEIDSEQEDPYANSTDSDPDFIPQENESSSESEISELERPESLPPVIQHQLNCTDADSDEEWQDSVSDIPNFDFDDTSAGVKLKFAHVPTPVEVFLTLWTDDIMDLFVLQTNLYGKKMEKVNRPHPKNSRFSSFAETNKQELIVFFGICLLQAQVRFPNLRKLFSYDPLYYHPVFANAMSGRRFEQLLRCFNCNNDGENTDRLNKISDLLKILIKNYQNAYTPKEALSLDESLLLHRGRLSFKQYIKGKKAKYGIKFYELCSPNGYTHNIEIYKGKQDADSLAPKLHTLVLRLMEPFLDKGHHLIMDNYYNSVPLCNKLLQRKTHTTGTLRTNRKGNPKSLISRKLKKGEHIWSRKGKVYVSKWKDKRDVICITTKFQPTMIDTVNSYGKQQRKPKEISEYNLNMSGVDRADQLTSYYSCPRKSVRWYKKVIFHLLDVTVVNSFLIFRETTKAEPKKMKLLEFRESIIRSLLGITDIKDGRKLIKKGALNCPTSKKIASVSVATTRTITPGTSAATPSSSTILPPSDTGHLLHILEKIPLPENYSRKSYFLRCRECSKSGKRGQTSWRCRGCEGYPPLCLGKCFENFHS